VISGEARVSATLRAARRRSLALILALVSGFSASVAMARVLDAGRPGLRAAVEDEAPYLAPEAARRLTAGFSGPVADWYWLNVLQYVGRKIEEQTRTGARETAPPIELDRLKAVNPQVLVRLFDLITTLDPRFTAVYEFAAVVLPAVDTPAALALLEKGIQANPDQWYLHQQLAYIYWQRGDYLAAADAFRRGARMTTAGWMEHMAERMERKGDDPHVARAMYARMYEQAQDDQVRQWALKRLMELRSLQERSAIRGVLSGFVSTTGRCPQAWTDVTPGLRAAGLTVDPQGPPLDPSGAPYVLVLSLRGCDVTLHRTSMVPRG
jgi:tetratricopeptide (TPR) repeat protein